MNLHDLILIIQYFGIVCLFLETVIVFDRWKSRLHGYLFVSCAALLVNFIGYLFELKAQNQAMYISALQVSYAGRVWVAFFLFLFAFELVGVKVPRILKYLLMLVHVAVYVSILTMTKHHLYYHIWGFYTSDIFPKMLHTNGIMHHVQMALQITYVLTGVSMLIVSFFREKNKTAKKRLFIVILSFVIEGVFFVIQIAGLRKLKGIYDLTMVGFLIGTIIMLVAIFAFDLLGTREIAKEFVIDRISEGIIAVDNDGVIQYYNEPALKLFPELQRKSKSLPEAITENIKTGGNVVINDRIYMPEENDLVHNGEVQGHLYALVDETEHYQYMDELQKQKDIADSANDAKSKFLANMSHEIRTPINAVLGMDEMILREAEDDGVRGYAANIMSAGKTLLSLINDILDLSKIEEGKMEIIPVQYELASLVNDLFNMVRDRAQKKGLALTAEVDRTTPHLLYGDEIRIRQCALNLLTNAVKYTEKGSVSLKVSYEKKGDDNILLSFTVSDTGMGMKKEDMDKLFAPYQRIEEKRNRSIEGTGLGMSITKQLLYLMGSELSVESEYGKGTSVSFAVEQEVVNREEIGDYSERLSETAGTDYVYHELFHAPDARILVVDDTEMNLTVIKSLLKKTGIKIDTAGSGKEALVKAENEDYDALFIDHMMPGMDGVETLSHMRSSGKNVDTPAVALTANAISGAREMYLAAGFSNYLSKPVDGEKLEKLLFTLLPEDKCLKADETVFPGQAQEAGAVSEDNDDLHNDIITKLCTIPNLNPDEGIKNCGSVDGYMSVLEVFHQTAKAKSDEIEKLYDEWDIPGYTIKVHALKSSSRIIGAAELSKLAEELEAAGKNGDGEYIREKTSKLLEMYRTLDKMFNALDKKENELPDISRGELKEAYQTMIEIAGSMDYEMMDEFLKSLRDYRFRPEDEEHIITAETMFNALDWDGITQEAEKALKNMEA